MWLFISMCTLLAIFIPLVSRKTLKPMNHRITSAIAGFLLVAMVWIVKPDGSFVWKVLITVVVVASNYDTLKDWLFKSKVKEENVD